MYCIALGVALRVHEALGAPQDAGSIRGVVTDKDFGGPLAGAQVTIVEAGRKVVTADQGNFVFTQVPPGRYTLVFSKDGYARQVKADVLVTEGRLTDVDVTLEGEFTEMEEFVVQDVLQFGAGTEIALLKLRLESPALMDSIGADLMSRAGASDAASALRLIPGATVQNGKFAVIRGLPDRYVSSQMNGVRLPSADESKRAVELDQFPSAVIESLQVSKTFTPDQQGDASGGAVNVRLKGIPDETVFQLKTQGIYNTQVTGRRDFLGYDGGGVNTWGTTRDREIQTNNIGSSWDGAVGTSPEKAPTDYKTAFTAGSKHDFDGVKVGALVSLFYERTSSFHDNGINDSYWVETPGGPMVPQTFQGTPAQGDFKTGLYDVTQATQSVKWGGLATCGVETENHSLALTYLYTRAVDDTATLAEDTRGKAYFFPGYDPNDPMGPGNQPQNRFAAPYLRLETLEYTERTTGTLQLDGRHKLPIDGFAIGDSFKFKTPEFDWIVAESSAKLDQPDKRQFGALWLPPSFNPGAPPFVPPFTTPPTWLPFKPAASITLGNLQRIWKTIDEQSDQYSLNLKLPFEQWSSDPGYFKFGYFDDHVHRTFNQDSFSNFNDNSSFIGGWDQPWSGQFPSEDHPITASFNDVDYKGDQKITAYYGMLDLPLSDTLSVIGGARSEATEIGIVNSPEKFATWFPPGAGAPVDLKPGDADVTFREHDLLPSIGLVFHPVKEVTLRGSYSETVARQTFKELTPIIQEEYLGGPIFIGNPQLKMSSLKNYDLRLDYAPYEGGLLSASYFKKDIKDPIEYVQRFVGFDYTTAVNYPDGELSGEEFEIRQSLGRFWDTLTGLSIGANATLIRSSVSLPIDEIRGFRSPAIKAPITTRDMTNAPDHLYNYFIEYDLDSTGTQLALFYTVKGDTLVAGATETNGNFVPSVYAKEYDTLNLSVSQKLGEHLKLQFQAKNLTNPKIKEVYRSEFIRRDVTKTSYTKGIEYSIGLILEFRL